MIDASLEIVDHRQQLGHDALAGAQQRIGMAHLEALARVLEVRLRAQRLVAPLRGLRLRLLERSIQLVSAQPELRPQVLFQLRIYRGDGFARGVPEGSLRRAIFPRTATGGGAVGGAVCLACGHGYFSSSSTTS